MIQEIFLILCGEDECKRPRSKKLLTLLKHSSHYKIIISGLSSFNLHPNSSESSRLSTYLTNHGISDHDIILEEQSMDTLGNIVFSHKLIEKLLQKYKHISRISLITNNFHLHRSRRLFSRIFKALILEKQLTCFFIGTKGGEISMDSWYKRIHYIFESFLYGTVTHLSLTTFYHLVSQSRDRYLRELAILYCILYDFYRFDLKNQQEFENYLYSLPIYKNAYHASDVLVMTKSLYSRAICCFLGIK